MALPFLGIYVVSTAAIRGSGHPRTSLVTVLIYNGCYALLAFLVSTFTDMGLLGVSRALFISSVLAAIAGLLFLFRGNDHLHINRISIKFDKEVITPMIKVGVPVLCENMMFSFGRLITQTFSVTYGTNAMAANGIVANINAIMSVPIMAAQNAAPPIVGRACGMDDKEGAMRKGKQLLWLIVIIQIIISILGFIFLVPLSKMMSDVLEVQTLVKQVLSLQLIIMPVGFTLAFVTPAIMRSSGDSKFVLYVNVATMFTMRIGMAYFLTQVLRIGIGGIWIGMYSDWVIRIIFFLPRFVSKKWLNHSLFEKKE
jgi:Na+-driven multidrug efflux pump